MVRHIFEMQTFSLCFEMEIRIETVTCQFREILKDNNSMFLLIDCCLLDDKWQMVFACSGRQQIGPVIVTVRDEGREV